jgi:hypothetical protein
MQPSTCRRGGRATSRRRPRHAARSGASRGRDAGLVADERVALGARAACSTMCGSR